MNEQGKKQRVVNSLRLLMKRQSDAMEQCEETVAVLREELGLHDISTPIQSSSSRSLETGLPSVDRSMLSVIWRGKSCFLGNTLLFRLFERLSLQPNRYVSHDELLDDVWDGLRSSATIRHAIKRLRDKLTEAGMHEVADAIDGSEPRHYVLRIDDL